MCELHDPVLYHTSYDKICNFYLYCKVFWKSSIFLAFFSLPIYFQNKINRYVKFVHLKKSKNLFKISSFYMLAVRNLALFLLLPAFWYVLKLNHAHPHVLGTYGGSKVLRKKENLSREKMHSTWQATKHPGQWWKKPQWGTGNEIALISETKNSDKMPMAK